MAWVIAVDLAILGGKITKLCPLYSSSLQNVQRIHIIQYTFSFIRRILQYDVFITNKLYLCGYLNHFNHSLSWWAYVPRKQRVG